ncbi:unnamed protein product [Fusarium graminearum]|uniref:Chromosome 4, complete genome n=1 Tax=Gibberella zeae (strain ATCC MYA-4620 / CBS 123657 / FGSC 9075 / NRRL 31084 / PH-1) TaxID=229533 RepID=A0A098DS25_GIBZE|nr:unnamed protein product [Fusarium graminearum]
MNSTLAYEIYSMCDMSDKSIAMYSLKEISTVHICRQIGIDCHEDAKSVGNLNRTRATTRVAYLSQLTGF